MKILARLKLLRLTLVVAVLVLSAPPAFGQDEAPEEAAYAQQHYRLGRKYYLAGQTEQAIEALYDAVSVRELYPEAQMLLGRSLLKTKRYREAAAIFKGIGPPQRHTATVQKLLGQALYQANKLSEASKALNYAIVVASRPDPEIHYTLGLVYLRQGEPEQAMREAKTALGLRPHFHAARKLLSDAYVIKDNLPQAELELARYLRGVRNTGEATTIKERLAAIRTLRKAKSAQSVKQTITLPHVHEVPKPKYTDEAIRHRVEGTVRLEVLFGSDATIRQVIIIKGLGFGLDEKAMEAARKIRFTPGEVDGKPVSIWSGVVINFSLLENELRKKEIMKIPSL